MKEAAQDNLESSDRNIDQLITVMMRVGDCSYDSALNKLGRKSNKAKGKDIIDILVVDEEEEENGPVAVDEAKVEHHDYQHSLMENHPHEAVYVNEYSALSVPEGYSG
jgi:hypothetical protein